MNNTNHNFNFDGGDQLRYMGASWFVSFCWYWHCDRNHNNWKKVGTWQGRVSRYEHTTQYHKFWLEQIVNMNENLLDKNKIGLKGLDVKQMASILLQSFYN